MTVCGNVWNHNGMKNGCVFLNLEELTMLGVKVTEVMRFTQRGRRKVGECEIGIYENCWSQTKINMQSNHMHWLKLIVYDTFSWFCFSNVNWNINLRDCYMLKVNKALILRLYYITNLYGFYYTYWCYVYWLLKIRKSAVVIVFHFTLGLHQAIWNWMYLLVTRTHSHMKNTLRINPIKTERLQRYNFKICRGYWLYLAPSVT